jgi:hypothetical protein
MTEMLGSHAFEKATPLTAPTTATGIGTVFEIAGSSSQVMLDLAALDTYAGHPDPVVAGAGSVGSQIKMRVGATWLIANIRSLKLAEHVPGKVAAMLDFLGEGDEEKLTGKLYNFRRGVTRYPTPGAVVFPVSTADLKQIYAADDRATIEIGTVFPTRDIRASLYIDAMLGKHFALLGSTGTGKSTSAALILHKICELAPQGHIVMVDPHGEYSAAFKTNGAIYDVSNLQMPYWLMNFEEHCEVFVTTSGSERQIDADILAKCLLAARGKGRLGQEISKLTVDAPIPYLLSDLTNLIQLEMGKMDRAGDTAPYLRLKTKIDEIKADPRYGFMFSGMLVADTMSSFISQVFRMPGDGKPISIIDVSGVPSEITSVVVAVLARMVFDFAIWSRNEPQRQGRPQIWCVAGPDHAAPVGPRRGRAVAMRHDHLDAPQQRPRPGLCPRRDARGCAWFSRFDPGTAQPRMHHLRRGRRDPDPCRVRRPRGKQAPGLGRPDLLRTVARGRSGRPDHQPHRPPLARAGKVTLLKIPPRNGEGNRA